MDLDHKESPIKVDRQNVVFGCPCEKGDCANNGSCVVNATSPLVNVCKCVGAWTGLRCDTDEAPPGSGQAPREYSSNQERTNERTKERFIPLIIIRNISFSKKRIDSAVLPINHFPINSSFVSSYPLNSDQSLGQH